MNLSLPQSPSIRFHISLNVSNLERSVAFYRILFNMEPAKLRADYAKFEPDDPPLVVSLEPNGRPGAGTLNHLGFRMPDARSLVATQERLERAGIHSKREEGVECCYAKQTKFWALDPDGTLWEMYTLEGDIDHRGAGQSRENMVETGGNVWEHRMGDPVPTRLAAEDNTLDEVRLRGSFNLQLPAAERRQLLAEAKRALKPSGRLFVHVLTGEREITSPNLPGLASRVEHVPLKDDVMTLISAAGFHGLRLLKYDDKPCFVKDGVAMRETQIEGWSNQSKGI
jgi:catechol 2,3-dioxygenase-like lactoylglutathione lyase family enzyme